MANASARPLVLATGNRGKVLEFQALLAPAGFTLLTPADIGFHGDVEETGDTFARNAYLKAAALAAVSPHPVLSDDSGLEVDALGGAPGIYSARYSALALGPAGPWLDAAGKALPAAAANRAKLLKALLGRDDRKARFRCVLCYLVPDGQGSGGQGSRGGAAFFEGVCEGEITREERGDAGFGYDPLFIPRGQNKTFAELDADIKDAMSHRGKAAALFLKSLSEA